MAEDSRRHEAVDARASEPVEPSGCTRTIQLTHIINPADATLGDDPAKLREAQPIVFQSIENAVKYAHFTDSRLSVGVAAVYFREDEGTVPSFAHKCPPLDRSVLDIAEFEEPRMLPLLKDILERVPEGGPDEYFIYTNSDIILSPEFYTFVAGRVREGHDAISITRRTLPDHLVGETDLSSICTAVGTEHPGHDCFVFSSKLKRDVILGETCVGARYLVPPFLAQLMSFSEQFVLFKDRHLTFHIGDDRSWGEDRFADYAAFNWTEGRKVLKRLHDDQVLADNILTQRWLGWFDVCDA